MSRLLGGSSRSAHRLRVGHVGSIQTRCARPEWWLLENVPRVPDVKVDGYTWQRVDVQSSWFSSTRRLRHFQFGSWSGAKLEIPRGEASYEATGVPTGRSGTFDQARSAQGLPDDYDLPSLTREAARQAVINGVSMPMGRAVAQSIASTFGLGPPPVYETQIQQAEGRDCECGCGRKVHGTGRVCERCLPEAC